MNQAPFEFRFRVRYGECDAQGVVFNARYGDYVDIAVNEYIRTLFGSYQNLLDTDSDIQVVSLTTNWKAPGRFDDVLCATIAPGQLGNSSFSLHLVFRRFSDGEELASADITYVMISPAQASKKIIPDNLRHILDQGASGIVISHAGEDA
ncbi:acyl-CoA thioesterase [Marinobacter caseinilyticus]|uniref:acyl-CoA thioesterase n=1 Tax=Marinobacter caseinilyticus TaxID=2692195 RepID=UPI0014081856|nr:thioesterase family protein [Marinobacter caseinilyticus]